MRATMSFRRIIYGPYALTLMEGDEPGYCEGGPLLVSLAGPGLPLVRLTRIGSSALTEERDGPLPTQGGLVILGHSKVDRPRLGWRGPDG